MSDVRAIFWNGEPVEQIPALSRGLHYGDGVFRTMLLRCCKVISADAHLDRLIADADVLGIKAPALDLMRAELEALAEFGTAIVKLVLIRSGSQRGYNPASDNADRLLLVYRGMVIDMRTPVDGILAIRSSVTLATQPLTAGIKHLNRLEQVLASRHWPDYVQEALLGDDRGMPVCGTRSNLFWVRDNVLHTPALDRCGVAGVTRSRLLALAGAAGIECRIGSEPWTSLLAADEAFICGSLIGIWPLRAIDAHEYSNARPLTRRLQAMLGHPYNIDRSSRP